MVKSSELVVTCEGLFAALGLVAFQHWGQGTHLPLEVLFPAHVLYYLLTFSFACPGANHIRKFLTVFGLVFGDMLVTATLLHHALPSSFSMLCLQFIVVFTVVHLLEQAEVAKMLSVHAYRGLLFILEGVLKSTVLVTTLQDVLVSYHDFRAEAVVTAVTIGSLRLLLPPGIYCIDQYLCSTQRLTKVNAEDMLRYLRLAPLLCLIGITVLAKTLPRLPEMQEVGYTAAHLLLNLAFVAWFAWDAVGFGRKPASD